MSVNINKNSFNVNIYRHYKTEILLGGGIGKRTGDIKKYP